MQPQTGRAMRRFMQTPLGRAVAQALIAWLILQPLWDVSRVSAREDAPLQALFAWALAFVRPTPAHAGSVGRPRASTCCTAHCQRCQALLAAP